MYDSATPWTAACQATLYFTIFWSLTKLMFTESVMLFNHLLLCYPLLLLPSIFPSIRVFPTTSVQSLSRVWLFATPWTAAHQASLSITNSQSLLKLMSIELVMPSNYLILCWPLLLLSLIFPNIRVFASETVFCIRWPNYWSFSISISPNEYSGLISFRIDWLDLLAVQGTLRNLLQHHSSKASILWRSAFFMVQLSHLYMITVRANIYSS